MAVGNLTGQDFNNSLVEVNPRLELMLHMGLEAGTHQGHQAPNHLVLVHGAREAIVERLLVKCVG